MSEENKNNIEGMFLYQGIHTTQQVKNIKNFFKFLLIEERFDSIIEIGTSLAGLTYILDDIHYEERLKKNIHTFDNAYRDYVEKYLKEREIPFHVMDEFTDEFHEFILNLINNGGKTLLLCDGGSKQYEFNKYAKHIKSGDFIMAHDYAHDELIFETKIKDKVWNWFEIQYKDIEQAINENNLKPYEKINFDQAAWGCFYKK